MHESDGDGAAAPELAGRPDAAPVPGRIAKSSSAAVARMRAVHDKQDAGSGLHTGGEYR